MKKMASFPLSSLAKGEQIFIDSTIFLYHFTGVSADCRTFLQRCENGEVKGVTSVIVLAEIAHRLMLIEALSKGLISGKNLVRKLREKPEIVKQVHLYQEQVERIPVMGISVASLDLGGMLRSAELRIRYGLMTNDSLVAISAIQEGIPAVASADKDIARVKELNHYFPGDLPF